MIKHVEVVDSCQMMTPIHQQEFIIYN